MKLNTIRGRRCRITAVQDKDREVYYVTLYDLPYSAYGYTAQDAVEQIEKMMDEQNDDCR